MVGIVLVSHSRPLADALVPLIREMASEEVRIAVAAGIDADDGFGTDAMAILEAIQEADSGDGVLVLGDVGSALLSTDMALEFLTAEERQRTCLSAAPFVEGALSAAVQASMGSPLGVVLAEAEKALQQKQQHVASGTDASPVPPAAQGQEAISSEAHTTEATLRNPHGLHARPAAKLVRMAGTFDTVLTVENVTDGRGPVSARSLSAVSTLGAGEGDTVRLAAEGPEAQDALDALSALINEGFGELEADAGGAPTSAPLAPDPSETEAANLGPGEFAGLAIQPGTAVGPALPVDEALPDIPVAPVEPPEDAWNRLQEALQKSTDAISQEASNAAEAVAGILDAQSLLLEDPALRDAAHRHIHEDEVHPARAWMDAVTALADQYAAAGTAYLRERAADVRDVGRRVLLQLLGERDGGALSFHAPAILIAKELPPSLAATLDVEQVLGVICAEGSPTAHNAILLRGHGIPTVFGVGAHIAEIDEGTTVGLDGGKGRVWIDPSESVIERLTAARASARERAMAAREHAHEEARTTDGTRIFVEANVTQPAEAEEAARQGADGVGLLRTEFLFDQTDTPPSELTQVESLTAVAEALGDRPLTIRVLDAGGDKPLPYLTFPAERNPFLGLRGIRVLLQHDDLFQTQLRAILRVGARHQVRLLLPMVATTDEVTATREAIATARATLEDAGHDAAATLPVGIMVETPASALLVPQLIDTADFFSIGTNDLTQYAMAADREHTGLAALSDALHPPVLRLMQLVTDAAPAGTVSICGEAAADPVAVPLLIGLGIHRLSMRPSAIPETKALIRTLPLAQTTALAEEAVRASSASAVRSLVQSFLDEQRG